MKSFKTYKILCVPYSASQPSLPFSYDYCLQQNTLYCPFPIPTDQTLPLWESIQPNTNYTYKKTKEHFLLLCIPAENKANALKNPFENYS